MVQLECANLPRSTRVGRRKSAKLSEIRRKWENGLPQSKKRNRTSQYTDLNDAVCEWFKKNTERRIPIDGPLIQEFATKVAEKLGYADFKASSGCLTRFKERRNLSQHKVCGESADWCTSSYSFLVERAPWCNNSRLWTSRYLESWWNGQFFPCSTWQGRMRKSKEVQRWQEI